MRNFSFAVCLSLLASCAAGFGLSLANTPSQAIGYSNMSSNDVDKCLRDFTAKSFIGSDFPWTFTIYTNDYNEGELIVGNAQALLIIKENESTEGYKTSIDLKLSEKSLKAEIYPFMQYLRACSDKVIKF